MIRNSKTDAIKIYSNLELCKETSNYFNDECIICFINFKSGEIIRRLNCNDYYHKKCIDNWLIDRNMSCPKCLREIIELKRNIMTETCI